VSVFRDHVVFITGAGSGLGRGMALEIARRGGIVVATDRDGAAADAVAAQIRATGAHAESLTLDVTVATDVTAAVQGAAARHGRLDFMFNNAGIGFAGEVRDSTLDQWQRVLDVNVNGVIHGVLAAYPIMVRQGSGHLVNTASLAGLTIAPTMAPYATSKYAVVGLGRSLRPEAKGLGVRVTTLCPSFIESAIYENSIRAGLGESAVRSMLPFPIIPLEEGIALLLAGVEQNEELVVVPKLARTLWRTVRWAPWLLDGKMDGIMGKFRKRHRAV
jgi:NAD(P)-dependent dehydrogenase (short-subunit alcohol dehydrogenase family)